MTMESFQKNTSQQQQNHYMILEGLKYSHITILNGAFMVFVAIFSDGWSPKMTPFVFH